MHNEKCLTYKYCGTQYKDRIKKVSMNYERLYYLLISKREKYILNSHKKILRETNKGLKIC